MTYLDVMIVAFIAFWALATIVESVSRLLLFFIKSEPPWTRNLEPYYGEVLTWHSAIKSYDVFKLLSAWHFFSKGGWYDPYVYVRGFCTDCTFTEWKDVTPKSRAGAVRLSFPTKYEHRAIRKIASGLARQPDQGPLHPNKPDREPSQVDEPDAYNPIIRRVHYQFLLHYIRLHPFDPAVEWCQFLIASSKDNLPPPTGVTTPPDFTVPNRYVLFVSPFHKVNPQAASPSSSNTDSTKTDRKEREETPPAKQAASSSVNERYAAVY